ncbi:hypothetical protein L2E82_28608 [Cichorium intybus]|uniref:Uncharacterized protein n=1 Tax=Cichorium intybus TaxID=13427 RepID=A0ACB9CWE7_CICIN|nr:hypothetical protein L2E82_28608 [Cichorium intybus]
MKSDMLWRGDAGKEWGRSLSCRDHRRKRLEASPEASPAIRTVVEYGREGEVKSDAWKRRVERRRRKGVGKKPLLSGPPTQAAGGVTGGVTGETVVEYGREEDVTGD